MPRAANLERIAIVGVGGIFPGAHDLNTFWNNISLGVDSGQSVPDGRWYLSAAKAFAPWPPQPDRVYSTWGCFIEGFSFDPEGLNLQPEIVAKLDPMFHLGLHAARAAYRDAGTLRGTDHGRVGVILGNIALPTESTSAMCRDILGRTFVEKLIDSAASASKTAAVETEAGASNLMANSDYVASLKSSLRRSEWHALNRFAAGLPSSLIAEGLGLGGLAFTLDAACASSLYSLKFACEELLSHRADAMLAGGMSRPDCHYTQMGFAQLQALSRQGRCAPLSAQADGLVVGEGAGVFVLKRLSDAVAAKDHIYGVIAGIGLSNDRGANLLAPHSEGQLRAMRAAYDEAGWKPSDIDLIECHATGTPVGDGVEIASLHQLWEHESARPRQCVIGGVKSNVGHLLTGAGAAGLMKVLFSLKHETLPPTANFSEPAAGLASPDSPFQVLGKSIPWVRRDETTPRRATINAFGFGGINAHVLIEEWMAGSVGDRPVLSDRPIITIDQKTILAESVPIAIVGLDVHLGDRDSKQAVEESEFPKPQSEQVPLNWWGVEQSTWFQDEVTAKGKTTTERYAIGNGITEIRLPMGQFRIPPLEMQDMLPQQQLMLKVADGAIRDAFLARQTGRPKSVPVAESNRTGVFIGIELDPNTTNFHFRWAIEQDAAEWARQLGLELSPDEFDQWVKQLKDAVGPPLSANRVMGNLGGIVASRLAREFDVGGPSFTISCGGDSGRIAFELASHFLERGELDTAIVGSVDFETDVRSEVRGNTRQLNDERPHFPQDGAIAFVLRRRDDALRLDDRIYAVTTTIGQDRTIERDDNRLVRSFLDERSISQAESLLESTLRTYHRGCNGVPELRDRVHSASRVRGSEQRNRRITFEPSDQPITPLITTERFGRSGDRLAGLFVFSGRTPSNLLATLEAFERFDPAVGSCSELARQWYEQHSDWAQSGCVATIVAADRDELGSAIIAMKAWVQEGCRSDSQLPRNVFASGSPRADEGRLAFVFPGSGSVFPGMGRELLAAFPEVLDRQDRENERLESQYRPDLIWSRDKFAELLLDHKAMIFSQVAIGTAICDLMSLFGVHPTATIGYSLGESAALFGMRAWTDRDEMYSRMEQSPLFGSDLVAPFDAARKAWNIPLDQPVPWGVGFVDRSAAEVQSAMERLRQSESFRESGQPFRLYLLIVNTPRQCVIGGDKDQLKQLVRELKTIFVPFAAPSSVHCNVLRHVEGAYRQLHLMRTTVPWSVNEYGLQSPVRFYSTAWGRSYDLTRESAAEAIVAQAVDTIDFPRVIEQAYADGVRRFVEIGPGSSCTKMIGEILADRPHFAESALPITGRPVEAFYLLLAALINERVPVDLSYLYGQNCARGRMLIEKAKQPEVVTKVGGLPFQIPDPPNGWKFRPTSTSQSSDVSSTDKKSSDVISPDPIIEPKVVRDSIPLPSILSDIEIDVPRHPVSSEFSTTGLFAIAETTSAGDPLTTIAPASFSLMEQLQQMIDHRAQAHEAFLRFSARVENMAAQQLALLSQAGAVAAGDVSEAGLHEVNGVEISANDVEGSSEPPRSLNRQQCMEFAIGKIGRVLGKKFAEIDNHPTRVRLPDEPLMLVDRILTIEGEPLSMTSGRVVTEHDILPGAWYLDCGRIPTCIAVESGQADLFLSGWLGIDLETKGIATYRLLDAVVTFHDALPNVGKTIHYDIRVLHFFRQGSTFLFRFEFDATVDGQPLLTMREGCAGFFTPEELASGKGIIHTALDKRPRPGTRTANWSDPVPLAVESYDDAQLLALRRGDLATCFGPAFVGLPLANPVTLPGLVDSRDPQSKRSRMWLIDRVLKLDPVAGKFGMGTILGELDIHPDDWFLTCHFCDDQVMPGTLMYECCLHTLRIFLLRMGWIGEDGQIAYEPIPGIRSRLKCRGQVLAGTKKVWYEVTLKELGYGGGSDVPSAYCLADALMYADGKPIVEITDMSVRLTGLTRDSVERLWSAGKAIEFTVATPPAVTGPIYDRRKPIVDTDRITAFAIGRPSDAFGDRYRVFDDERKIARLPGPPFQFLDRVVSIENCQPWVLQAGGEIVAQYDVPVDAWYFSSNRQPTMPFAVLLETALQPCGWLAGYLGSALTSDIDLSFRNLGGTAIQYREVTPNSGTLTTTVKMTRVSNSAGMIIQHYDFDLRCQGKPVYVGNTYFGFFSKAALSNQIGIRDAAVYRPTEAELARAKRGSYPQSAPFPDQNFRMIQTIECLVPDGGPYSKGCIVGTMPVDPASWFFKAHFYQDPVVPGSLGLESFWQLLKVYATSRWQLNDDTVFATPSLALEPASTAPPKHEWVYRGQVIPKDQLVTVTAVIKEVDDVRKLVTAEGFLSVDGRVIYQMKEFRLGIE